ncbi:hypothetical protein QTO34_016596 [Cnephaeus nilssonii]|uniref:Uncharacterized protein n=1 Tax=Cnephaeus nilssonii TaxID=3371016 RepID=A0AA40I2L4_CNENI|nr:hypothetical protein QTO34_016596 [Eptesicus nilssonii]
MAAAQPPRADPRCRQALDGSCPAVQGWPKAQVTRAGQGLRCQQWQQQRSLEIEARGKPLLVFADDTPVVTNVMLLNPCWVSLEDILEVLAIAIRQEEIKDIQIGKEEHNRSTEWKFHNLSLYLTLCISSIWLLAWVPPNCPPLLAILWQPSCVHMGVAIFDHMGAAILCVGVMGQQVRSKAGHLRRWGTPVTKSISTSQLRVPASGVLQSPQPPSCPRPPEAQPYSPSWHSTMAWYCPLTYSTIPPVGRLIRARPPTWLPQCLRAGWRPCFPPPLLVTVYRTISRVPLGLAAPPLPPAASAVSLMPAMFCAAPWSARPHLTSPASPIAPNFPPLLACSPPTALPCRPSCGSHLVVAIFEGQAVPRSLLSAHLLRGTFPPCPWLLRACVRRPRVGGGSFRDSSHSGPTCRPTGSERPGSRGCLSLGHRLLGVGMHKRHPAPSHSTHLNSSTLIVAETFVDKVYPESHKGRLNQEVELWSHLLKAGGLQGGNQHPKFRSPEMLVTSGLYAEYHKGIDYIFGFGMRNLVCTKQLQKGPQLALIARLRPSGQGRKPLAEAWALGRDPQLARITCKGPQLAPLEGSTPSQGLKPLAEAWALGRDPQLAPITCRDPQLAPFGPPDGSIPRSIQGKGLKLLFEAWALVRDPQLAPITAGDPSWFQWPSSTPSQCRKPLAEARALGRDPQLAPIACRGPQLALITCGGPPLASIFPSDLRLQYPSSNNCSPRLQPSWLPWGNGMEMKSFHKASWLLQLWVLTLLDLVGTSAGLRPLKLDLFHREKELNHLVVNEASGRPGRSTRLPPESPSPLSPHHLGLARGAGKPRMGTRCRQASDVCFPAARMGLRHRQALDGLPSLPGPPKAQEQSQNMSAITVLSVDVVALQAAFTLAASQQDNVCISVVGKLQLASHMRLFGPLMETNSYKPWLISSTREPTALHSKQACLHRVPGAQAAPLAATKQNTGSRATGTGSEAGGLRLHLSSPTYTGRSYSIILSPCFLVCKMKIIRIFSEVPSAVPDLSLASTVFGQNRPRDAPFPASGRSPASHPVTTFRPPPGPANAPDFFCLTHCRTAMSSPIRQNYSTQWRSVTRLANPPLRPPHPPLSGLLFPP